MLGGVYYKKKWHMLYEEELNDITAYLIQAKELRYRVYVSYEVSA